MASRPAAGGGRWVEVAPERLAHWLDGFADRHGAVAWHATGEQVSLVAADGARAEVEVPFPPLSGMGIAGAGTGDRGTVAARTALLAHVARPRRIGVLLVRLGGFAAGVIEGDAAPRGATGSRPVHGRAAAGGWSQHRFARRREGQVRLALTAAADLAVRVLVPEARAMDAVVTGGDRAALGHVLDDPRLAPVKALVVRPVLDVPDPRRSVLDAMPARVRAVRIRVVDGSERAGGAHGAAAGTAKSGPPEAQVRA